MFKVKKCFQLTFWKIVSWVKRTNQFYATKKRIRKISVSQGAIRNSQQLIHNKRIVTDECDKMIL